MPWTVSKSSFFFPYVVAMFLFFIIFILKTIKWDLIVVVIWVLRWIVILRIISCMCWPICMFCLDKMSIQILCLYFLLYFFHYYLSSIYPTSPEFTTLLSRSMSHFFLFPWSLSMWPFFRHIAVILLSIYESVCILMVCSVCLLGSTCEWNHVVFGFLWLVYFT